MLVLKLVLLTMVYQKQSIWKIQMGMVSNYIEINPEINDQKNLTEALICLQKG